MQFLIFHIANRQMLRYVLNAYMQSVVFCIANRETLQNMVSVCM